MTEDQRDIEMESDLDVTNGGVLVKIRMSLDDAAHIGGCMLDLLPQEKELALRMEPCFKVGRGLVNLYNRAMEAARTHQEMLD
jgi:hypothetical protein